MYACLYSLHAVGVLHAVSSMGTAISREQVGTPVDWRGRRNAEIIDCLPLPVSVSLSLSVYLSVGLFDYVLSLSVVFY